MNKLTQFLPYFGAIPFVTFALCLAFNVTNIPVLGDVKQALNIYGLVIASFMAGTLWGLHLHFPKSDTSWHYKLPIFSNIIAVLLWFAYIALTPRTILIALILGFLSLIIIDWRLMRDNLITKDYFNIRFIVTRIVILSLIVSVVFY